MRQLSIVILSLALCGGLAWAQTGRSSARGGGSFTSGAETQGGSAPAPADHPWMQTLFALAEALTRNDDGAAHADSLAAALPADTLIRRFDHADPQDRLSLRVVTAGGEVVAALGYVAAPTMIASDLSAHLRDATFVPEALRAEFALDGASDAAVRRANETASQWVMGALQPGVQQPVGVIALWQERAPQTPSQQHTSTIVFVLVKGQELAPGAYRITYVVYGGIAQIVR